MKDDQTGGAVSTKENKEKNGSTTSVPERHQYTLEELEKELADAVVASSKIDDLTTAIKAAKEGRFFPHGTSGPSGSYTTSPYGSIYRDF